MKKVILKKETLATFTVYDLDGPIIKAAKLFTDMMIEAERREYTDVEVVIVFEYLGDNPNFKITGLRSETKEEKWKRLDLKKRLEQRKKEKKEIKERKEIALYESLKLKYESKVK